jgi:hypothetical protein
MKIMFALTAAFAITLGIFGPAASRAAAENEVVALTAATTLPSVSIVVYGGGDTTGLQVAASCPMGTRAAFWTTNAEGALFSNNSEEWAATFPSGMFPANSEFLAVCQ